MMKTRTACFLLALALAVSAFAQGNLGGVTGIVADTSNAAVPEVRLTLTSTLTNTSYSVTADSSGVYTLRGLPPGVYRLEAEKQGFKSTCWRMCRSSPPL